MSSKSRSASRARLMNPSPQDMRDLVLDYLMHNCHTGAARAFMKDCGVKRTDVDRDGDQPMFPLPRGTSDADLRALEERLSLGESQIRNHILTGRIDEATELIHKRFPLVLSEPMEDGSESLTLPPRKRFGYLPATSTDPTHLALNLRIQAFVEAARTIPLLYRPPGADVPLPHPPLLSAAARTASSGDGEDSKMSESDVEQSNVQLLHRAQSLYSEVNRLPRPADRATYLVELGQVGGILAYPVPENSPLSKYMEQARREALADQIDSAILYRARRPTISRVELYSRYTGVMWSLLHEKEVNVPPRNKWPTGVTLPPTSIEPKVTSTDGSLEGAIPAAKKPNPDKETDEARITSRNLFRIPY
ncbi:hypothetical protein C8Q79DRAFT_1046909 [Trametes meyenii]|nr:hypothetical protein C8Q79DRAFT_1046909 [Trametes meyenii]